MGETPRNTKPGVISAESCYLKYLILTCTMVLLTIIITMCAATIPPFRDLCEKLYLPSAFFVLGIIPMGVFLFAKNVQERFPLNYALVVLALLLLSFAIPGITAALWLWNILSWTLTMAVSVGALIFGYKMEKLSKTSSIIVLSFAGGITVVGIIVLITLKVTLNGIISTILPALIIVFAILMVLYLTGQGIKRCSKADTSSILPIWLTVITWTGVVLIYLSISVMLPRT
ncbi:unnamed protein product, partial [Trichobilharzia szidati]